MFSITLSPFELQQFFNTENALLIIIWQIIAHCNFSKKQVMTTAKWSLENKSNNKTNGT